MKNLLVLILRPSLINDNDPMNGIDPQFLEVTFSTGMIMIGLISFYILQANLVLSIISS